MKDVFIHPYFESFYKQYPIILIDVGASGGIPNRWRKAEKYLQVVGFEPDDRAFEELKNNKSDEQYRFINSALHCENDAPIKFYLTKKQTNSSLFVPNFPFLRQFPDVERVNIVGSAELKASRLSMELLESERISDADFIKVDTQGSELFILQGGNDILKDFIFGVEVEVEFSPVYEQQPLFADIDMYLRESGFQLFDLKRMYWKRNEGMSIPIAKGQIIFADALYLKTYDAFLAGIDKLDKDHKRAKIFKALSICLIYGLVDYALYLCEKALKDNVIASSERESIFNVLGRKQNGLNFRGQGRLARFFYKIYLLLKTNHYYFGDEELGNG